MKNDNKTILKQLIALFLILLDSFQKEVCINFQKIGKAVHAIKSSRFHINQFFGKTDFVLGQLEISTHTAAMFLHDHTSMMVILWVGVEQR